MWVTDSELKCLGTNIRTGRVNSLPKKGSQIFIMFCAVSDSTIFLCKQRSTDSTDHLNFWQYHAALSIAADHIISNGTCSQNGHDLLWGLWFIVPPCPPPKHEPDIWWVKLGQAHWHLPFLFYNLWDNNHWDTPQSRGKEWQKQCFFLDCISNKKNSTEAFTWLETQQTSSNIIKLYTCVE